MLNQKLGISRISRSHTAAELSEHAYGHQRREDIKSIEVLLPWGTGETNKKRLW